LITYAGGAVSWQSKLQKCVALSTTEVEFIAATRASKELLWLKKFVNEPGFDQDKYVLFYDNQNAIHLSKNATFHLRSKHIDLEPIKLSKTAHKSSACAPLIWCLIHRLR
jgi:hypothetical protein